MDLIKKLDFKRGQVMGNSIKNSGNRREDECSAEWAEEIAARLRAAPLAALGSKSVSRRDALGLIGLGASVIGGASMLTSGPALAQAAKPYKAPDGKGRTLTVSVWGGPTEQAFVKTVVPVFRTLTGANVVFETGSGGERFNKLMAQGALASVDVFINSGENVFQANRLGKLVNVDKALVPNLDGIADWAKLFPYGISYGLIAFGLVRSTQIAPLKSWKDLWRPEFKGKLGMPGIGHTQFPMMLITLAEIYGGSASDVEPAIKKLAELDPVVLAFFWGQWADSAKAGKVLVVPDFNYNLLDAKAAGIDFAFDFPEEKAIAADNTMSIVKGSPNADLAHAFLNVTFDSEVQTQFCAEWRGSPANVNAKIHPKIEGQVPLASDILNKVRFFDLGFIATKRAEWTERLNSQVLTKWK
jgi:putative spermidine/putrescine transport system substrate-binding protein